MNCLQRTVCDRNRRKRKPAKTRVRAYRLKKHEDRNEIDDAVATSATRDHAENPEC